eukprot:scaffold2271_cov130-Cylindrotheca_fusiformis.AAC.1
MNTEHQNNIAYVNVTIEDASMAIKKQVRKKLGNFPKPIQNQAAHAAGLFTTPKKVAQILSQRLCEELPRNFAKRGIVVEIEEFFREGPYFVLKLVVVNVAMVENWIQWFTRTIGVKDIIEGDFLPNFVTRQLTETMPAIINKRMASNDITAETMVNSREDQEKYFRMKLVELRDDEEERRNKQPFRKFKKRMPSFDSDSKRKTRNDENNNDNLKIRYSFKQRISSGLSSSSTISSGADERDKENRRSAKRGDSKKGSSSKWSLRRKEKFNSGEVMELRKVEVARA